MKIESSFNLYFTILSHTSDFEVDLAKKSFSIEPDIVRKKGQKLANNQIAYSNQIRFSRKNVSSSMLESNFREFIDFLGSHSKILQIYLSGKEATASLDIVGDLMLGMPRPTLFFSTEVIKIIASLDCDFNIEIYAVDEQSPP